MLIKRTIPPAASPISIRNILNGLKGCIRGKSEIERFRSELKDYFSVRHVFLLSSGKAALTSVLVGLHDLHPGRNTVLIPAFCCYSVPSAILRAGLEIRLCDVDPDTLDFDFELLEKTISESAIQSAGAAAGTGRSRGSQLLAILPVHLFGLVADVERARRLSVDPEVIVVEDAAQVMGSEVGGRKLGTIGDVGFFSLGRGKAFSTVEGGVIVTNRDDIAEAITQRLKEVSRGGPIEVFRQLALAVGLSVFQHPALFWLPKSMPFLRVGDTIFNPGFRVRLLSAFQAGIARGWRERLSGFSAARRCTGAHWKLLKLPPLLGTFFPMNGLQPTYIRYPIRVREQALWVALLKTSQADGLGVMLTYPEPIHRIPQLKEDFVGKAFPAATRMSREILSLPVHPLLSDRDRKRIEALIFSVASRPPD